MVSSGTEREEESTDSSSDDSGEVPQRPERSKRPRNVLSFEKLGGNPVYKSVKGGKVVKSDGRCIQHY